MGLIGINSLRYF